MIEHTTDEPTVQSGAAATRQGSDPAQSALVHAWTDGACKGNPGPGGWGVLLRYGDHQKELYGGQAHTTNNRMEIMAVIQALSVLRRRCRIIVHTDSQYVKKGMTEWMPNWKRRNWRTADRKPVKNADLWQQLDALVADHDVQWRWVRGHAGDAGNERADALANRGVASLTSQEDDLTCQSGSSGVKSQA